MALLSSLLWIFAPCQRLSDPFLLLALPCRALEWVLPDTEQEMQLPVHKVQFITWRAESEVNQCAEGAVCHRATAPLHGEGSCSLHQMTQPPGMLRS